MPDTTTLDARIRALERHVSDHDVDPAPPDDDRTDALAERVDALDERIAALDADVQALQGFAGELDAVNDAVERRADAALAAVDRLDADGAPAPHARPAGGLDHFDARSDEGADANREFDGGLTESHSDGECASDTPGLLARLRATL